MDTFICGENLLLGPDAAATRNGLTMTLSKTKNIDESTGPELAVTFTADRPLNVGISRPEQLEVLYVRDGVIVGGGPMLNEAGDLSSQGLSLDWKWLRGGSRPSVDRGPWPPATVSAPG